MSNCIIWEEMKSSEIKERASQNAIVIIPVGSIEQHGPHLPVGTDAIIATAIARKTAERLVQSGIPAVVTPTVWMGISAHHMMFPGTVAVGHNVFSDLLYQLCTCIKHHGFLRVVLLNGHAGNDSSLKVAVSEINRMMGRPVFVMTYWDTARRELQDILEDQKTIRHACEAETSMMLALKPELVGPFTGLTGPDQPDPEELTSGVAYTFRTFEHRTKIGVIGNATSASKEKGERILNVLTENLSKFLSRSSLWEITL